MANDQMVQYDLITKEKMNRLTLGDTAPSAPIKGWVWIDTTLAMPTLKIYDGAAWRDLVASGTIVMWSGTIAGIPAGYKICDGLNSTPDLRDKFVKGALAGANAGATGGFATGTHAQYNGHQHGSILAHDHSGSTVTNAMSHVAEGDHNTHGTPTTVVNFANGTGASTFAAHQTHEHDDLAGSHNHSTHSNPLSITDDGGHQHTNDGVHSTEHGTHDNKPPFYAVIYLMKI